MRNNQPVTQREYLLEEDCALISHTDSRGMISHVNDEFITTSGFCREELIGQPHNLIRHPDMPAAAFADLWATLKKGRPWRGLVKNRRKNGDFYWVLAQVTPRPEGGYISVRIRPSREQVAQAEALYGRMRAGENVRLVEGEVLPSSALRYWIKRVSRISISGKLAILSLLASAGVLLVAGIGAVHTYDEVMAEKRDRTQRLVQVAHSAILYWKDRADRKEISTEQARLEALAAVRAMRYGDGDYFWIQDLGQPYPRMIMHPIAVKLDGTVLDAAKYETAESVQAAGASAPTRLAPPANLFSVASRLARENGEGFIGYRWQKPATGATATETFPKLSFVKRVPGWDWAVGSGIYVDDVRAQVLAGALRSAGAGLAVTAFIFCFALWQRRQIRQSLQKACAMADGIARGDLVAALPTVEDGELGELIIRLRIMRNSLHEVAASLRQNSRGLHSAAEEIREEAAAGARDSSAQSDSVSSIAAAVEELSVSIDQVDEHAKTALSVSQDANMQSIDSAAVIREAITEINEIAGAVNGSATSIRELQACSAEIATIVGTIRAIADQTNLLSLNAAIEAARAGDEGRGFAVVADEVRRLAERTAASTGEVSRMIEKLMEGTRNASSGMERSVERAGKGVALASRADTSMTAIGAGMSRAKDAVDGITVSLSEQSSAAREMAVRVENLAQGAEAHTLAANRTADEAVRMSALANEMSKLAGRFKITQGD